MREAVAANEAKIKEYTELIEALRKDSAALNAAIKEHNIPKVYYNNYNFYYLDEDKKHVIDYRYNGLKHPLIEVEEGYKILWYDNSVACLEPKYFEPFTTKEEFINYFNTPFVVCNEEDICCIRYYAGWDDEDGPIFFFDGKNFNTNVYNHGAHWPYCRPATIKDLEKYGRVSIERD